MIFQFKVEKDERCKREQAIYFFIIGTLVKQNLT